MRLFTLSIVMMCCVACSDGANPPIRTDAGFGDALSSADGQCGPNLRPYGPACVPILDDCADDEVPVPGGGCKKVGAEECLGGWGIKGPPDWQCEAIGVKECDPEWGLAWGPDWRCEPIGPPRQCEPGPTPAYRPTCRPVMPEGPCPDGLMPVVGSPDCVPIQGCGESLYGDYRAVEGAIYVHAGYAGRESDGSIERPYRAIGDAIAAAAPHDTILIGDGVYREPLAIDKPLRLLGRCPQKVIVVLELDAPHPSLDDVERVRDALAGQRAIGVVADSVVLRGLRIRGQDVGVVAARPGTDVTLVACEVMGCARPGVLVLDGARLKLKGSRLHHNGHAGAYGVDATLIVEDSAITDGQSIVDPQYGRVFGMGIYARRVERATSVRVRRTLLLRNRGQGIFSDGADITLEGSVIAETAEHEDPGFNGEGIFAQCRGRNTTAGWTCDADIPAPRVDVRRSLIARNHRAGVLSVGANVTIERSAVSDVLDERADGFAYGGVFSFGGLHPDGVTTTISESLVARNPNVGVAAVGAKLRITRSVVRDSDLSESLDPLSGKGVAAVVSGGQETSLELSESLIANNRGVGVQASGATANVARTLIVDTKGGYLYGNGHGFQCDSFGDFRAKASIVDSLLARNTAANLVLLGCDASVEWSVIRDGVPRMDGAEGFGVFVTPALNVDASGYAIIDDEGSYYLWDQPSHLTLRDVLVADNVAYGVMTSSSPIELERTIIRDTAPQEQMGADLPLVFGYGNGVWAQTHPEAPTTEIALRECVIARNHEWAVHLVDTDATLQNSVVRETRPDSVTGFWGRAINSITPGRAARLRVEDCLIEDNSSVGVALLGTTAEVRRSVLRRTRTTAGFHDETGEVGTEIAGDAIYSVSQYTLGTDDGIENFYVPGRLLLEDSLLEDNDRVGLFVDDTESVVRRSVFRGNYFPVYYEEALPQLDVSNVFEHNEHNEAVTGLQLEPAPPPHVGGL